MDSLWSQSEYLHHVIRLFSDKIKFYFNLFGWFLFYESNNLQLILYCFYKEFKNANDSQYQTFLKMTEWSLGYLSKGFNLQPTESTACVKKGGIEVYVYCTNM